MATTRVDPYRGFNFLVEIDGISQAGFQECSGLDASTDPVDYHFRRGVDVALLRWRLPDHGRADHYPYLKTNRPGSGAFPQLQLQIGGICAQVIPAGSG